MRNSIVFSIEQKEKYIFQISSALDVLVVSLSTTNLCRGGKFSEVFGFAHT